MSYGLALRFHTFCAIAQWPTLYNTSSNLAYYGKYMERGELKSKQYNILFILLQKLLGYWKFITCYSTYKRLLNTLDSTKDDL